MGIDVSIVIPTFNTGEKLDALLGSLARQSLPASQFEIVVVDDGSTDDTWQRLQEHARDLPHLRIAQIPNSGWPGRPRNVGTDLASGRYVFYCDHDDELFVDALRRMVDFADAADADVVVAKEVRHGARTIGAEAFIADIPRADVLADDVLAILTPHKLFRTDFLREHEIRFPEGKRRLEDHVFLAEVYTTTDRVAVLSSYPCYRWIIYADESNHSSSLGDPKAYFASLADVFDVLENADISDARRDAFIAFWYSTRLINRLSYGWFSQWEDDYRDKAIAEIITLAAERIPQRFDQRLNPRLRRRADLMRAGDSAALVDLAERDHGVHPELSTTALTWTEQGLQVKLTGDLCDRFDQPVVLVRHGDGLFWPDDPAHQYDLTQAAAEAEVELFVRQRGTGVEWTVGAPVRLIPIERPEGVGLQVCARWEIDPESMVFGEPLDAGSWSLNVRTRALGYLNRLPLYGGHLGAAVLGPHPMVVGLDHRDRSVIRMDRLTVPSMVKAAGECHVTPQADGEAEVALELPGLFVRAADLSGATLVISDVALPATLTPGPIPQLRASSHIPPGTHSVRMGLGQDVTPVLHHVEVSVLSTPVRLMNRLLGQTRE